MGRRGNAACRDPHGARPDPHGVRPSRLVGLVVAVLQAAAPAEGLQGQVHRPLGLRVLARGPPAHSGERGQHRARQDRQGKGVARQVAQECLRSTPRASCHTDRQPAGQQSRSTEPNGPQTEPIGPSTSLYLWAAAAAEHPTRKALASRQTLGEP
eukprot:5990060-Alexandrium_andersonii.AAC.1